MVSATELSTFLAEVSSNQYVLEECFGNTSTSSQQNTAFVEIKPTRAEVRKWPQELKDQRKMELHSKRMARFRNKKTAALQAMQDEHRRLEQELKLRVSLIKHASGKPQDRTGMEQLVLEHEALREENVALREEILNYSKFQRAIHTSSGIFKQTFRSEMSAEALTVGLVKSQSRTVNEEAGRWVDFQSGASSFYFHPFTCGDYNSILLRKENKFVDDSSNLSLAGKFLGWEVFHAPFKRREDGQSLLGHTRYCKTLHCCIEDIHKAMHRTDGSIEWPILPAGRSLGLSEDINIQTLQEFSNESRVIVCNYAKDVNVRYFGLVKCGNWEQIDGKRVLKYDFAIADTAANARSRDADPDQNNVRWVDEGGVFLTLSEVDETSVHVEFNHWACCTTAVHGQMHFIMFGQIVMQWEQLTAPSRLLTLE